MTVVSRDYTWHRREWEPEHARHFEPGLVTFIDAFGHDEDENWHVRQWEPK